jgi:ankyrin repeat protein/tetratricopeptide (TPR) repeat protein
MLKRIIVSLVVAVAVSAALFFAAVAWIEKGEGPPTAKPKINRKEDVSAAAAYHIDGEGRALAAPGRPPEDLKKAEAKYYQSLAMFKKLGHERGEAEVLNDLGIFYSDRHQYMKAVDYYENALKIKRRIGWSWGEGNSLVGLADLYRQRTQWNKVAEYLEQAVKAYEKAGDLNAANGIVNDLARMYSILNQDPKAIECLEKWVETVRQHKDPRIEAAALQQLGTFLISRSVFPNSHVDEPKAIGYLEKSVESAKQYELPKTEAKASYSLGEHYDFRARRSAPEQIKWIGQYGRVTRKEVHDQDLHPEASRDYSAAARYFEESSESAKRVPDPDLQQKALHGLGGACEHLRQNLKAIEAYEGALGILRAAGKRWVPRMQTRLACKLAALYYEERNYAKAAEHCLNTLESQEKIENSSEAAELQETLGKTYRAWLKIDPENEQLKLVKLVLDKGTENESLVEEISRAIERMHVGKAKALPAKGADVNVRDKYGLLPLETAAEKGDLKLVRQLVDSGADLKTKNRWGIPALDAAFSIAMLHLEEPAAYLEIAEYFLNLGADINTAGLKGRPALQCEGRIGSPEFLKLLLEKGADVNGKTPNGQTALMHAAYWGDPDRARLLLENGADLNAKNDRGETALMVVGGDGRLFREDPIKDELEVVKLLLERGAGVNDRDEYMGGRTAFMRYSADGLHEGVKLLVEKGASVNAVLDDGSNAFFWAVAGDRDFSAICSLKSLRYWTLRRLRSREENNEFSDRRAETAKLLIADGIDVNAKLKADGSTPLIWAAYLGDAELARLLLDKGANVDARTTDGRTPLMCAVTSNLGFEIAKMSRNKNSQNVSSRAPEISFDSRRMEVAKLLLDHKADVNAKRPDGTTALTWAMILGQTDMVQLLLERGANPKAVLTDGSTLAQWVALRQRSDVDKLFAEYWSGGTLATVAMSGLRNEVKRLLDEGADVNARDGRGCTALMESARNGDMETVKLLLERGANVLTKDERGWTVLNEALLKGDLDIAALLLDNGADPNAVDASGWIPLIQAAWKGRRDAVNLLIARGADIRAKDAFGKTAFMRAVEMGHHRVVALLLDKGADIKATDADGWTPVMAATKWQDSDMVKLLRERGGRMTVAAADLLGDEKETQRLMEEVARKDVQISDGPMALLIAARNGREDMVKLLLNRCPDIDIRDSCCDTALLHAIKNRHPGIAKALLEKGANVNAADDWRETALHYAVDARDLELVRMLLEKGANANAQTIGGDGPPLMHAIENADVEIVKALLEKGARLSARPRRLMEVARKSRSKELLELLKAYALKQTNQIDLPLEEDE